MGRVPEVELSSRQKMPLIGLGTGAHPFPPPELLESTILKAIKLGYRHFDTASIYQTEQPLGLAISQALRRGLISNRDELFVTSKLWCTDAHSDLVLPAIRETLQALGLEYVDLYLIHFPVRLKEGEKRVNFSKDDILPFDVRPTWEAMEECHRLGLARSIGVSNFSSKKLQQLLAHATIPPAVNQVEMNVGWQQRKLRDFCKENGIHVSAWSPLGAKGSL